MAMNVGELVATLDVDDKGYSRGLTTAAAEARVAANRIEGHLDDVDAPSAGTRTGGGFVSGLVGALRRGRSGMNSAASSGIGAVTKTMGRGFSAMGAMPWGLVAIVAAALAALPAIGAAAGTGIALGFGGGIAAVGLMAAAQADEVKSAFSSLKDDVVADLRSMAAPLEGTLVDVAGDLRGLFDSLAPHLEGAFERMAPILSTFSDQLFGAFESMGPAIGLAADAFNALLSALGPEMDGAIGGISDALSGLFETVASNPNVFAGFITGALDLVEGLIRLVDWLSQAYVWIQENIPGGLMTLLSPLGSLAGHLLSTGDSAGGLADSMRTMGDAIMTAWEYISSGASDLWETIQPILQDLWDALANSDVLSTIQGWWDQVAEIVTLAGELLGTIMSGAAAALGWIWDTFGQNILTIFSGLWEAVKGILSGAFEVIKGVFNVVLGVLTGDWSRAWEGIKQIFSGVWTAIKGVVLGALDVVKGIINGALTVIKGIFGGVWGWIKSTTESVWTGIQAAIKRAILTVRYHVKRTIARIKVAISRTWNRIKSTTSDLWNRIRTAIGDAIRGAYNKVKGFLSDFKQFGKDLIQGIINGVTGAAGRLASKLKGIAKDALGAAKDALGISSPSRVMRDEVGRWIPAGISAGLDRGERALTARMGAMTSALADQAGAAAGRLTVAGASPAGGGYTARGPAVHIERFQATERMSAHDVGEALYGLVVARG